MAIMSDNGASFSAAISRNVNRFHSGSGLILCPRDSLDNPIMKPELVKAAAAVITNQQILVNMVSRRVRQLCLGHRPLVEFAPGLREADIALTEIAAGKLTFVSTFGQNGNGATAQVVEFPGIIVDKKTKKKAA